MNPLEEVLQLSTVLDGLRPLSQEQEGRIMQKFRLDWNYNSNSLEGNSLTFGETKALILHGITAQGKPLKDHIEIKGHNEAVNWVMDVVKGDLPLNEKFIRELHTLLLKESYEVKAETADGKPTTRMIGVGQYKTTPNHVRTRTGEMFYFSTPEETPAKMHDLLEWYRSKSAEEDVNAVILAAEFHYKFIAIHPFDDGNGRTARILMNFILMKFNYPPVVIKTGDKENYFAALRQADAGIIKPFIDYIASNLVYSLQVMIAGAKGEPIDDPDDVDKEIALLEERLKGKGERLNVSKTDAILMAIYESSVKPLWLKFIETSKKFDRFYLNNRIYFETDGFTWTDERATEFAKGYINRNTTFIHFLYAYSEFNNSEFDQFNYESVLDFDFKSSAGFTVVVDNKVAVQKHYDEQLSSDDISKIIKILTKRHAEFIESHLGKKGV